MFASFHYKGTIPSCSDMLNTCASGVLICSTVSFSILGDIPSTPGDLFSFLYPIICLKSVDVRRLQVAILARSPREMSQTDRILPRYFLSRVHASVRPIIFYTRKNYKNTVSARSLTVSATTVRTAQQERQFIPSRQVALLTSQFTQMSRRRNG